MSVSILRRAARLPVSRQVQPLFARPLSTSSILFRPTSTSPARHSTTATQPHPKSPSESFHPAPTSVFTPLDTFLPRHLGPREADIQAMLEVLGHKTLDEFVATTIPGEVRIDELTNKGEEGKGVRALSELELRRRAEEIASMNKPVKSYIGMGYHNAIVPPVIQRNVFENPSWYTAYTPYSPEQSQGRLESLINFQTVAISLTGLPIANASLLDEATAAAEAMAMCLACVAKPKFNMGKKVFLVSPSVAPQTIEVLQTRASGFNIDLKVAESDAKFLSEVESLGEAQLMGALVQYPNVNGEIGDWEEVATKVKATGAKMVVATDLLALTMIKPPGEWGADIVCGNSQRFGVPAGYGGPHAAFFACTDDLKRRMPGRLVGLSKDSYGAPAYRLALQTREQHIRREKATSNVCTAQALLANMAAMYAVYHGPEGLRRIAGKVHSLTRVLSESLASLGFTTVNKTFFDTLTIDVSSAGVTAADVHAASVKAGINFRKIDDKTIGITLDESVGPLDLTDIVNVFCAVKGQPAIEPEVLDALSQKLEMSAESVTSPIATLARTTPYLTQPVFNKHHSETDMLRYMMHLQEKDYSLVHGMIPLGSCTMKLNSTSSMVPLSWKEFGGLHPFAPREQAKGYEVIIKELENDLSLVTGYDATSVQPNSGASGEYAGLRVIQAYHESKGEGHRDICLIPLSAHGTNPASAAMVGYKVVPIKALNDGSLDLADLREKAEKHKDKLAAFMVTYPSTFGVFEEGIEEACQIVHDNGGQVYVDGANCNSLIGLTSLGRVGGDVSHTNLHKTFSIPHGGGGPGVGPISCKSHLAPFLPSHPIVPTGGSTPITAVSAAPYGSASINTISWAYIKMLGGQGLTTVSKIALLNANYIAERLKPYYNLRFSNKNGRVAHECLIDLAEFEKSAGLRVPDFSKRLQDYSFHPPTAQWPISTCWLIEPTESESKEEMDRFIEALISIRKEIDEIVSGEQSKDNNVFTNAPHPLSLLTADKWDKPYSREKAVYPVPGLKKSKFWPTVGRLDDAGGDLNLVCECGSVEEYA
ncbi:glycine dehydrogenase mitochondrial precursor, putative [Cryptococcus gattii WM276]|uniref:Glycine cleavage system P protein n=1 Tax=Cryptococcus gattii serotype B (strain WM276 / ATCC MYA-4071) TaxID=367775 RepID=E6R2V8_CRYGW|nr:glycine dehydrogenase mitochondrial precursor, putative [Cryptococcus gattii WM276]ADV20819.1 glycine dehydrogenase mitochondrial precursor, putative [Cryptococcus gattii WM276]